MLYLPFHSWKMDQKVKRSICSKSLDDFLRPIATKKDSIKPTFEFEVNSFNFLFRTTEPFLRTKERVIVKKSSWMKKNPRRGLGFFFILFKIILNYILILIIVQYFNDKMANKRLHKNYFQFVLNLLLKGKIILFPRYSKLKGIIRNLTRF